VGEEELEEEELTCGVAQIQIWRAGAATGARRKETLGGTPRERGRWDGMEAGSSSAALLKRRRRSGRSVQQSAEADETDRERER
jgi:hypothetical protein